MLVKQTAENEATWPTKKTSGYPAQLNLCYIYTTLYIRLVCADPQLICSNYENAHVLIKLNWDEQKKRLPREDDRERERARKDLRAAETKKKLH